MVRIPPAALHHQYHQHTPRSRVFNELSSLILTLLRPSSPLPIPDNSIVPSTYSRRASTQISPAGFASLMLGISMALMLCGSVTFIIGFMLMPWVIGLFVVLYLVGLVSVVSMLARALLFQICAIASPPPKHLPVPEWKLL